MVFTAILYALGGYGKDKPGAVIKSAIIFWYIGMLRGGAVGCLLNGGRTLIEISEGWSVKSIFAVLPWAAALATPSIRGMVAVGFK